MQTSYLGITKGWQEKYVSTSNYYLIVWMTEELMYSRMFYSYENNYFTNSNYYYYYYYY